MYHKDMRQEARKLQPKFRSLFGLGGLVIVLPFLGFPQLWKNIFIIIIGALVIIISYKIYFEISKLIGRSESADETYVENNI